ncbi:MAG: IS66 family insertion sequence element accessory protein TnpB [Sphingomonadaceae bacterium]
MLEISTQQVWLVPGPTDMRKSIDSLAAIVTYAVQEDPLSRQVFVFCSKDKSKIKILWWDLNGFWLLYKRLEKGRFHWPDGGATASVCVTGRQLRWLLDGLSLEQRLAHKPLPIAVAT